MGESKIVTAAGIVGYAKPRQGSNRYLFSRRPVALDIALSSPNMRKPELLAAMKGHVLAQGELIGTYAKPADRRSAERGEERSTHGRH